MDEELEISHKKFSFNIVPTDCYEHDVLNLSPLDLYYNAEFKSNTRADLNHIKDTYNNVIREFTIIKSPSMLYTYKALHYLYNEGMIHENMIRFIDGAALEESLDLQSSREWNYKKIRGLFYRGILKNSENRWIVIVGLNKTWTTWLVEMFCKQAEYNGALGIIFQCSDVIWNFGSCLESSRSFRFERWQ